MKIALAQLNFHIGNFDGNVTKVIAAINQAKTAGAELVIFSELSLCGYPPRDFLEFDDFISKCENAIACVAQSCLGIAAIIGAPSRNTHPWGKRLFNSAYFIAEGKIKTVHHKALLPNYDIFDEYRYFEPAKSFCISEYKRIRLAITVCEDIWDTGDIPMYTISPIEHLMKHDPHLMINISASPFDYEHAEVRKKVFSHSAKKYRLPLLFVNHVGAQTELIFDGGSMVLSSEGEVVDEMNYFGEDIRIYDIGITNLPARRRRSALTQAPGQAGPDRQEITNLYPAREFPVEKVRRIHEALILGIKDYFNKMSFEKAIVGLSGGIDSAVTCVLACKALGKENVLGVLMPSPFSSRESVEDAQELVKNLGCKSETIPIEDGIKMFDSMLRAAFIGTHAGVTEENIQARIRAVLLMALANKFGYILLNTTNKSEAAVGYGTLYGDMCGGLSVLGDLYKKDVYEVANFINNNKEVIPLNSIKKPPSAELRPGQKDSDDLPAYAILDNILFQYIERHKSPREIIAMGFDEAIVGKILYLVNNSEWKRYQAPPILRVSPKAFGMGRRMPIVGKFLT